MRKFWPAMLGAIVFLAGAADASAERRIALVVGNTNYVNTAPLRNPANDAQDFAATLRKLGFDVTLGLDLDQASFARKIDDFARLLDGAEVGLFFYAGHGMQINEKNHLVSTNAKLESEFLVSSETIELDAVIRLMESKAQLNLVFLDACRNNPLAETLKRRLTAQRRSIGMGRGLAKVEPTGRDTLIAFSAAPGQEAADGKGRNSPFTGALLRHVDQPGVEVSVMLKQVAADVREATSNEQRPQQLSDMTRTFYFAKAVQSPHPAAVAAPAQPPPAPSEAAIELAYWQSTIAANNCAVMRAYLTRFPKGTFAELARLHERDLCKAEDAKKASATRPPDVTGQPEPAAKSQTPVLPPSITVTPATAPAAALAPPPETKRAAPPVAAAPPPEPKRKAIERTRRKLDERRERAARAPPAARRNGGDPSRPSHVRPGAEFERPGWTEGGRRCKSVDMPGVAPRVVCD
ncbi:MAG: caspase family protein [Proteobacteria bacterium]|nr:caspase family protein [Pseudomonadota bacterium]